MKKNPSSAIKKNINFESFDHEYYYPVEEGYEKAKELAKDILFKSIELALENKIQ